MVIFEKTWFGGVRINGNDYRDVVVVGEEIKPRQTSRLDQEYGGHHLVGDFEIEELLANQPEVIIIGNGQSGVLEVSEKVKERMREVKLLILKTPPAIAKYNQLVGEEKKVNCLIHVTC